MTMSMQGMTMAMPAMHMHDASTMHMDMPMAMNMPMAQPMAMNQPMSMPMDMHMSHPTSTALTVNTSNGPAIQTIGTVQDPTQPTLSRDQVIQALTQLIKVLEQIVGGGGPAQPTPPAPPVQQSPTQQPDFFDLLHF